MISYLTKLSFNHKLCGSLGAEVRLSFPTGRAVTGISTSALIATGKTCLW